MPTTENLLLDNEKELLSIIRESKDPGKVASYMFSIMIEYLQTHAPAQGA